MHDPELSEDVRRVFGGLFATPAAPDAAADDDDDDDDDDAVMSDGGSDDVAQD